MKEFWRNLDITEIMYIIGTVALVSLIAFSAIHLREEERKKEIVLERERELTLRIAIEKGIDPETLKNMRKAISE